MAEVNQMVKVEKKGPILRQPGQPRALMVPFPTTSSRRYWFDFGDDWYHQVQVDTIAQAIPSVTYRRVIKRLGKSPPRYPD